MIYTVKGPISQKEMGITLSHEHFKWECDEDLALGMYYDKRYNDEANENLYARLLPIMMSLKKAKGIDSSKLIEMLCQNPSVFYNIGENEI